MEKRPLTLLHRYRPPSDVFINSSQIQLVGLFVRRVSLSSPFLLPSSPSGSLYPFPVSRVLSPIPSSRENENEGKRATAGKKKEEISPVLPTSQRDTRDMYSRGTINFLMVPPLPEMIFVNDPISNSSSYSKYIASMAACSILIESIQASIVIDLKMLISVCKRSSSVKSKLR